MVTSVISTLGSVLSVASLQFPHFIGERALQGAGMALVPLAIAVRGTRCRRSSGGRGSRSSPSRRRRGTGQDTR